MSAADVVGSGTGRLLTPRFGAIALAGLAYITGWTILYPVLPRFVENELGGSGAEVGLSIGAFGVTAALLRPAAGRIGDRRGRRVLVVGGMLVAAVALAGNVVAGSVAAVIALRLVFGVGEAFTFVGLATAIQDLAPDERRGEAANYFSFAVYGGLAAGPPLGEWLHGGVHYDRVWLTGAALALVGAVLGLATPANPSPEPSGQPGWIHPAAVLPGLALAGGLFGYAGFVSFAAVHARDVGLANAGWVFSTYAMLIMVTRLAAARVPDRFGAARVSALSLAALGSGLLLVAVLPGVPGLFIGVVVFSAGMAMNFPALLAHVVRRTDPADRAFVVASLSLFFDLAFATGAVAVGAVVAVSDERTAFAVGGLFALAGLIPLWFGTRSPAPVVPASS